MSWKLYLILGIVVVLFGCEKPAVGYLQTEHASYSEDQLTIVRLDTVTPDNNPELYERYEKRIVNESAWVTSQIEGVLGTDPIMYYIEGVKVIGKGDATVFSREISVMGGGRLVFPFKYESPKGLYAVSIRVVNEGYSKVIEDAYYISIE